MKIISIYCRKGGSAKTTIATNLSYALSQKGKKVLLIDADPQQSTTNLFAIDCDITGNIVDVLLGKKKLKECLIENNNLYVLPGSYLLSRINIDYAHLDNLQGQAEKMQFDFVLVDCSGDNSENSNKMMVLGDCVLIPTIPQIDYFNGLIQTKGIIDGMKKDFIFDQTEIVICRYDGASDDYYVDEIKEYANKNDLFIYNSIIRESKAVKNARSNGKTVFEYRKSNAQIDFENLASELLKKKKG